LAPARIAEPGQQKRKWSRRAGWKRNKSGNIALAAIRATARDGLSRWLSLVARDKSASGRTVSRVPLHSRKKRRKKQEKSETQTWRQRSRSTERGHRKRKWKPSSCSAGCRIATTAYSRSISLRRNCQASQSAALCRASKKIRVPVAICPECDCATQT